MVHIARLARRYVLVPAVAVATATAMKAAEVLPTGYTAIGTDATATFGWAKEFAIGVVVFGFVMSLVKLAKKR